MKNKREWVIPSALLRDGVKFSDAPDGDGIEGLIRFKFAVGQLSLTGFNQNYWRTSISRIESEQLEEFLVSPGSLQPISTVMSPNFTLSLVEHHCKLKWLNGEISFDVVPADEFPATPLMNKEGGISVDVEQLQSAIDRVKPAIAKTRIMVPQEAAALVCEGSYLTVIGCSPGRMHTTVIESGIDSEQGTILLPPRMVAAISAIKSSGRLLVRYNDFIVHAEADSRYEVVGSRINGSLPPKWRSILDRPIAFSYEFDRTDLELAMSRLCSTKDHECKVNLVKSGETSIDATASSTNPPRSMRESIECSISINDEPVPVLLDAAQILDAARSCKPSDRVTLNVTKNQNGRFIAILEPVSDRLKFKAALAMYKE